MTQPTPAQLRIAQRALLYPVGLCVTVLIAAHLAPMQRWNGPHSNERLACTLAYFVAAVVLLIHMLGPRERLMRLRYAHDYADCPEGLRKAWQSYTYSLNSNVRILIYLLLALVCSIATEVLVLWWLGLQPLATLAWYVRIASIIALVTMPLYLQGRLMEVVQRRRLMHELRETSDFVPGQTSASQGFPVRAEGRGRFRAGGYSWHLNDFYKNAVVFGQTGTGKTLCVLNALLDGILASTRPETNGDSDAPVAALILDPKGDFVDKIQVVCKKHNRHRDLLVLDPLNAARSIRWNPLDSKDDELQLAGRFVAVMEALGQRNEKDSFFTDASRTFLRHAIRLTRLTNPPGEPPSLDDVHQVATSAQSLARRAHRLDLSAMTRDDDATLDYFADQWTSLAPETRSSIVATLSNMIDPFLMEPYRSTFSGRSDITVGDAIDQGKIIYVYMPIADREAMSRTICTIIKLEYFREVLRRPNKKRPSLFFCDEFQCFFTTAKGIGDADFFERSRQSNHANIIATQNFPALLKYSEQPEPVDNLLGNCGVKVFLRNTDEKTNRYAAGLFGKELQGVGSVSVSDNNVGRRARAPGANIGYQESYKVRPETFAELRVPAPGASDGAQSIVHMAARDRVTRERLTWDVHPL